MPSSCNIQMVMNFPCPTMGRISSCTILKSILRLIVNTIFWFSFLSCCVWCVVSSSFESVCKPRTLASFMILSVSFPYWSRLLALIVFLTPRCLSPIFVIEVELEVLVTSTSTSSLCQLSSISPVSFLEFALVKPK